MKYSKLVSALAVAFLLGLGILLFQTIYGLRLPKFVEEINNSALGAILTALITVLLLSQQSHAEEMRARNAKVFERKAVSFTNFIDLLWEKWSDFRIEPHELHEIRSRFYRDVYIYLPAEPLEVISEKFHELSGVIGKTLDEGQRKGPRNAIFTIIRTLKKEIGLDHPMDTDVLDKIDEAFEKALKTSEDVDKKSTIVTADGQERRFWHFIAFDAARQREILESKHVLVLGDGEGENEVRTRLLQTVSKGDILFLYARGSGYIAMLQADGPARSIPKSSNERLMMGPTDGAEGHLPVKPLIMLHNGAVARDAPRLRTIQRIYDPEALRKLITEFDGKADKGLPPSPTLQEIKAKLQ